jgi:hypothetical protein
VILSCQGRVGSTCFRACGWAASRALRREACGATRAPRAAGKEERAAGLLGARWGAEAGGAARAPQRTRACGAARVPQKRMRLGRRALSLGRLDVKVLHPNGEREPDTLTIPRLANNQRRFWRFVSSPHLVPLPLWRSLRLGDSSLLHILSHCPFGDLCGLAIRLFSTSCPTAPLAIFAAWRFVSFCFSVRDAEGCAAAWEAA